MIWERVSLLHDRANNNDCYSARVILLPVRFLILIYIHGERTSADEIKSPYYHKHGKDFCKAMPSITSIKQRRHDISDCRDGMISTEPNLSRAKCECSAQKDRRRASDARMATGQRVLFIFRKEKRWSTRKTGFSLAVLGSIHHQIRRQPMQSRVVAVARLSPSMMSFPTGHKCDLVSSAQCHPAHTT